MYDFHGWEAMNKQLYYPDVMTFSRSWVLRFVNKIHPVSSLHFVFYLSECIMEVLCFLFNTPYRLRILHTTISCYGDKYPMILNPNIRITVTQTLCSFSLYPYASYRERWERCTITMHKLVMRKNSKVRELLAFWGTCCLDPQNRIENYSFILMMEEQGHFDISVHICEIMCHHFEKRMLFTIRGT